MQITLVQSEIEEALTNYVMSQINIKAGMKVCIDLTATRGADGFKAIIDIVPANKVITPKQVTTVATAQEPPFDVATPVAMPVVLPVTVQQPIQEENKPIPEVEVNSVEEAIVAVTAPVAEEVAVPTPPPVEPAPPTVRSLFAGLKRPVNTP
jgi:hypothetical protein